MPDFGCARQNIRHNERRLLLRTTSQGSRLRAILRPAPNFRPCGNSIRIPGLDQYESEWTHISDSAQLRLILPRSRRYLRTWFFTRRICRFFALPKDSATGTENPASPNDQQNDRPRIQPAQRFTEVSHHHLDIATRPTSTQAQPVCHHRTLKQPKTAGCWGLTHSESKPNFRPFAQAGKP